MSARPALCQLSVPDLLHLASCPRGLRRPRGITEQHRCPGPAHLLSLSSHTITADSKVLGFWVTPLSAMVSWFSYRGDRLSFSFLQTPGILQRMGTAEAHWSSLLPSQ